jgi:chloride channel protein, CIC family
LRTALERPCQEIMAHWLKDKVLFMFSKAYGLFGEHAVMIILAFLIGLLAGTANVIFRFALDFVHRWVFVGGSNLLGIGEGGFHRVLLPLLPIVGAILLIPLTFAFPGEVNGYGFSRFIELVNIRGGVLKIRNIIAKMLAPALTIGSGGSAGVEGPIAVIGGTIGSGIGQLFRASGGQMKLLIAAGAGAGIAATFNAPIAGIMFAIEIVLLGSYELSSFAAIVIASGAATVVSRGYYGVHPQFEVPQYNLRSPLEIPLYVLFGLIVGVLAVFYIKIFHRIKDEFNAYPAHPLLKPALGALIIGVIGIFLPQIMGNGYEFVEHALAGKIIFPIIALLAIFKILATSITLGSGGSGGVFAPAIFIGAMIGGSFGNIVHYLFPAYTASPGAYATVGIGAFLAAATHAPLTGIFLIFEMTGNYQIIIPLMFAAIIGTLVSKKMSPDSIDTVELTQKGIKIHAGRELTVMGKIKVKDVMNPYVIKVGPDTLLKELIDIMVKNEKFYIPVVTDSEKMLGIVSIQDVRPVMFEDRVKDVVRAGDIVTENIITLKPGDDLNTAMEKFAMKDIAEIPVIDEADGGRVVAMLRRKDVIDAYNKEVLKEGLH